MDATQVETLDTVIDFMETALVSSEQTQEQLNKLQAKLAAKEQEEKILLEKVAAAQRPIFEKQAVDQMLLRLERMNIIPPEQRAKMAAHIMNKPASMLAIVEKLSDALLAVPTEGFGVPRLTGGEPDPDGWNKFYASAK